MEEIGILTKDVCCVATDTTCVLECCGIGGCELRKGLSRKRGAFVNTLLLLTQIHVQYIVPRLRGPSAVITKNE
jgi:hypothetical protein